MKKIIIVIAIAAALLLVVGAFFGGLLPLGISANVNTVSETIGGFTGNDVQELIPRKGFICSYISTEWSERITAEGSVSIDPFGLGSSDDARYVVYLKKDQFSDWELVSDSGVFKNYRSEYISAVNPGSVSGTGTSIGGTIYYKPYDFEVRGNDYANGAVKVELYSHINENILEFWRGAEWRKIASDEAYLYSGWGGLYLPIDTDGRPRSTFEIGEHVKISVETAYGAMVSSTEGKTWRVVLRNPAGQIHKQQDYGDNIKSYFEFDVTAEMWRLGQSNHWQLEIFNVLVPKGTLHVDTIDFLANAPSDVIITGEVQSKVGNSATIGFKATINDNTQADISYFRVCAIYGTNDVLLPSDPLDTQWIFSPSDIPPTKSGNAYVYTLRITPEHQSYVTIHAKAVDVDGRSSLHTKIFTFWAYDDNPAREEDLEEETGEGDYWGGRTNYWYPPVEPTGEVWKEYLPLILGIAVFIIMLVIAFIPQTKLPVYARMIIVVLGVALAVFLYWYLGGDMGGLI